MPEAINVYSEIGPLKKVLLHRPGGELENLMPEHLDRLLFDDIPYLKAAQVEHDQFAALLRQKGCEVVYLEDLTADAVSDPDVRARFIIDFIHETGVKTTWEKDFLQEYFASLSTRELIEAMCSGVRKSVATDGQSLGSLISLLDDDYPFLTDPMPNLYFTRDPFASVGNGVTIHRMRNHVRTRESLFAKYIFTYHPLYRGTKIWYDRTEVSALEGGDVLVLSKELIAIGISQRTSEKAIEKFSNQILGDDTSFNKVLAFNIPKERSFMHLDTVFTMVDKDKFTVHPNILNEISVFVITKDSAGNIKINQDSGSLEDILKRHLRLDKVTLIRCGHKSRVDAAREQWNDGSNTLAIAPGEVVVYERNQLTNRLLEDNGVKTHQIVGSELSRGRGGPRCMSMPLMREDLKD